MNDDLSARSCTMTLEAQFDPNFLYAINQGRLRGSRADQVIYDEIPSAPTGRVGHLFEQDPEEQARLCKECGMWPEHHNHGGRQCVCAECMPDADTLPDDQHAVSVNDDTHNGYEDS